LTTTTGGARSPRSPRVDIAGLTVHIEARVGALARAGEVLVSHTIKDLVQGSGFEFHSRGTHDLKGVRGAWEVFALSDGQRPKIAIVPEPPTVRATDRLVIAAARRAPGYYEWPAGSPETECPCHPNLTPLAQQRSKKSAPDCPFTSSRREVTPPGRARSRANPPVLGDRPPGRPRRSGSRAPGAARRCLESDPAVPPLLHVAAGPCRELAGVLCAGADDVRNPVVRLVEHLVQQERGALLGRQALKQYEEGGGIPPARCPPPRSR
jgi:hypothetical protein